MLVTKRSTWDAAENRYGLSFRMHPPDTQEVNPVSPIGQSDRTDRLVSLPHVE